MGKTHTEAGFTITMLIYNTVFAFVKIISTRPSYYTKYLSVSFPVSFVLVYFLMRETKKVAFEDMEQPFASQTRDVVSYRVKVVLPYLFRRSILWRNVELEPFEESRYSGGGIRLG
jgi:hypothetical protein